MKTAEHLVPRGAGWKYRCEFLAGDIVQHGDKGSPAA